MKKQYAVLWLFVLLLSLSLILFLMQGNQRREGVVTVTATPLPTETPRALALAATRFLPTVAPPSTATPLPTPLPTMTAFVLTLAAPTPRVFVAENLLAGSAVLTNYCTSFGSPVTVNIFDWTTGNTVSVSDAAIAQIPLGWDASNSIWEGYQSAHPFNQPADAQQRWKFSLFLQDESERWIEVYQSAQTPDLYYAYSFQKTVPYTDRHGQHFGYHPCRAFTVSAAEVQNFLDVVGQYQDVVHYPGLISGTDTRWTRGIAQPVAAYADVRSIPSTQYNDPIGSIDQPVTLWYAIDPGWGTWAQIKIDSLQGWVDTRSVKFLPAP